MVAAMAAELVAMMVTSTAVKKDSLKGERMVVQLGDQKVCYKVGKKVVKMAETEVG